eukprot:44561-Pyramimonas_sp.AAC.1
MKAPHRNIGPCYARPGGTCRWFEAPARNRILALSRQPCTHSYRYAQNAQCAHTTRTVRPHTRQRQHAHP